MPNPQSQTVVEKDLYFSDERWLLALERMRQRILSGVKLVLEDSNSTGDKYTHCSWGMCSGDREQWPDSQDHLFPDQLDRHTSPKYTTGQQRCPLDKREPSNDGRWGCFYHCRMFNGIHSKKKPQPSSEDVVKLYDIEIERFKNASRLSNSTSNG